MCDLTKGFTKTKCKVGVGGNKNFYPFNASINPFTVVDKLVTAISEDLTEVYKYELTGDGHTLTENLVSDRNSGTSLNTQTIVAITKGITAEKSNEFEKLVYGFPSGVIEDRNGNFHAIGLDDGIDFTVDVTTGSAKNGELVGYTLTGVATTGALSPKLEGEVLASFLALVVDNN